MFALHRSCAGPGAGGRGTETRRAVFLSTEEEKQEREPCCFAELCGLPEAGRVTQAARIPKGELEVIVLRPSLHLGLLAWGISVPQKL